MQHLMQDSDFFTHAYMLNCMSLIGFVDQVKLSNPCMHLLPSLQVRIFSLLLDNSWMPMTPFRLWRRIHEFSLCQCCSMPLSLTIHKEHLMLACNVNPLTLQFKPFQQNEFKPFMRWDVILELKFNICSRYRGRETIICLLEVLMNS